MVLIFVIFVVHPGCHEIFRPRNFPYLHSAVCMRSNLDQRRFVMALFHYLRLLDSVLDTQALLSQAAPRVMAEEVNRAV